MLYLAGLLYFLGVSIIADLFMEAIEVITSKTRVVKMGRTTWRSERDDCELTLPSGLSSWCAFLRTHDALPPTPCSCAEMPLSFCACFDHLLLINFRALRSRSRSSM